MQCSINVLVRRVRAQPLLQQKNNKYYIFRVCVCACSFRYTACNAHASYYVTTGPSASAIFSLHYLINGTIFEKKVTEPNFCLKHLILRKLRQYITMNVQRPSCKVPVILVIF